MIPDDRRPELPNYYYKIYQALLRVAQPPPGRPARFGEMTSPQKLVAVIIAGRMYGERKFLALSDGAIAGELGWGARISARAARKRVDRALRGRTVRGVWYPGLIENGWVEVGPGTRTCGRTIGATEMLMALGGSRSMRDPRWLPFPVEENGAGPLTLGQSSAYPHMGASDADLGQSSAYPHMGVNLPPHGGQLTPTWGYGLIKDEIKSSSSQGLTVPPGGEPGDDDDCAALRPDTPECNGHNETPSLPIPPVQAGGVAPVPTSEAPGLPQEPSHAAEVGERGPALADTVAAIVALLRVLFGEVVADRFRSCWARVASQIKGRWDCYTAAAWQTSVVRPRPDDVIAYLRTVALDFATNGIDPETLAIAERHAAKIRAIEAREAEARRQREQPPEPAPSAEETVAELVAMVRDFGPRNPARRLAERRLAELGFRPDGSPS